MAQLKIDLIVDNKGSVQVQKFAVDAQGQISRLSGSVGSLNKQFLGLGSGIKSAFAGLGGAYAVRELIGIADSYTNLESRLRLVTKSEEELLRTETALYQIANQTRGAYEGTVDLYTRLARSTKDAKVSQAELLAVTKGIGQALIVSGASAVSADAAIVQLGQGLASGTLRGEELNSILEQTPRVAQMIADGLGVGIGQLKKFGAEGKLTSEVVLKSLLSQTGSVNAEFAKMEITAAQAGTVMGNTLKDLVDSANEGSGATKGIASSILGLSQTISENKEEILSLFQGVVTGANWATERISNMVRAVKGAAAVAAGALDLSDFATMNPAELQKWMRDFDDGTAFLRKRLKETREELAGLSDSTPGIAPKMAELNKRARVLEAQLKAAEGAQKNLGDAAGQAAPQMNNAAVGAIKLGDSHKAASEAAKQHREELRLTSAEVRNLVSDYKRTTDELERWVNSASKTGTDMVGLNNQYSAAGGGEVDRLMAERHQAYLDGISVVNKYHAALSESGAVVAQAQAEYSRAQTDLAAMAKELEQNPLLTGVERENRLAPFTDALRDKAKVTREAMAEQVRLNDLNAAGVLSEDKLSYAIYGTKDAFRELSDAQLADLEASTRWADNMQAGLMLVADESSTAGRTISGAIKSGFDGASDALTDFVLTGKASFSDLTDSIIRDLTRMVIQQNITTPLASGFSGFLKDIFPFEGGGIMTSAGPMPLRKYAGGGIASSPQLAMFGEGSVPEAYVPVPNGKIPVQLSGGSGGGSVVVNVIESSSKAGTVEQSQQNGTDIVDVFVSHVVSQAKSAVANDVIQGGGVVAAAFESTYRLNRAGM